MGGIEVVRVRGSADGLVDIESLTVTARGGADVALERDGSGVCEREIAMPPVVVRDSSDGAVVWVRATFGVVIVRGSWSRTGEALVRVNVRRGATSAIVATSHAEQATSA
ncbi:MAG: hypothetical protein WKG01_33355 [Kofleriaceae bacterium]